MADFFGHAWLSVSNAYFSILDQAVSLCMILITLLSKSYPVLLVVIEQITATWVAAAGAIATAIGAWATFFLISRRTVQLSWTIGFREQYTEFWQDEDISTARRWITSDIEYDSIKEVLYLRMMFENNVLNAEQNKVLDQIDRMLACLTRMHYFIETGGTEKQRRVWRGTYNLYWVPLIKKRPELLEYVEVYWRRLNIRKDRETVNQLDQN